MALSTLIAAILIGPPQSAPPDVPKNHWAYPAVDRMFQKSLLKGYPSGSQARVELDPIVKLSLAEAMLLRKEWLASRMFASPYVPCRGGELSRYDLAYETYSAWANITGEDQDPAIQKAALPAFPKLAYAISGFNTELTKLGADTKAMIAKLNSLQSTQDRLFLGNRR